VRSASRPRAGRTAQCTSQGTQRYAHSHLDVDRTATEDELTLAPSAPLLPLLSRTLSQESDAPIFSLGQVQFTLPSALHSLSCTSNVLLLACTGNRPTSSSSGSAPSLPQLIRIDLDRPTEVDTIDVPLAPPAQHGRGAPAPSLPSLHKVHVDPAGRHVLVSTSSGDNFYVFIGTLPAGAPSSATSSARRAKPLTRLKGAIIEAIAWSPSSSQHTSFSTGGILLGTTTGQLLETCLLDPALDSSAGAFSLPVPGRSSVERYVKQLFTLAERQSVVGLQYEVWGKRVAVVAATATRVHQFVGAAGPKVKDEDAAVLEAVMQPYSSGDARPSASLSLFLRLALSTRRWTDSLPCRNARAARRPSLLRAALLRPAFACRQVAPAAQEHGLAHWCVLSTSSVPRAAC